MLSGARATHALAAGARRVAPNPIETEEHDDHDPGPQRHRYAEVVAEQADDWG